jgi:signal peptidase I
VSNKPRRLWIAAVLTLLVTGLGHLYSGNPKRGIILFGINQFIILAIAVCFEVIAPRGFFLLFAVAVEIAFIVFCISDALSAASRKNENDESARCNRWFEYIIYIGTASVYAAAVIIFVFMQPYRLPTRSMEPTLLIGDHFIVNKLIYKIAVPKRGDIIVFKHPGDPKTSHLKRLIGEPGDKVEIIDKIVYINGKPLQEDYVQYIDTVSIDKVWGPYHVPAESYFVLGDNRDNSMDSRYYGFVPRKNLIGKPLFIYLSSEASADGEIAGIRWRRIFRIIK